MKPAAAATPINLREAVIGCPIRASVGVLGRKFGLLVLRDVAFCDKVRFSDLVRSIDGLTARTLTFRLRELQREGLIRKASNGGDAFYELTPSGEDVVPILTALTSFGVKHRPAEVFRDGRPRTLAEIVPAEPDEVLGAVATLAVTGRRVRVAPPRRDPSPRRRGRPRLRAAS